MELMNIKTALSYVKTFYGLDVKESDFEEIALNAWELIGTKHTELKGYVADSNDCFLKLPCDVAEIESVHIPVVDSNISGPLIDGLDGTSIATERYIDVIPALNSPYYQKGKLIKYKQVGDSLQFAQDFKDVLVVYHAILLDENGLPLINDKEMRAIAAYVAHANLYKEGIMKRDANIINLAGSIKTE